MSHGIRDNVDIAFRVVKPPKSPAFLKKKSVKGLPAAFEQSLPWAEIAENQGYGHIAWYSKDVMRHEHGHVECVIIAKDSVISAKEEALREVITAIHQAGYDIEVARRKGELAEIVTMIQKHIPKHTKDAIIQSLRPDLNVINYHYLNIDNSSKASLRKIMNLAFEAGFLKTTIDIDAMADESFSTKITTSEL